MSQRSSSPSARFSLLFLAVVLFGSAAAYALRPPPPRTDDEFVLEPRQGDQLGLWMNPRGTAGGWQLSGGNILQNHGVFRYEHPASGARLSLELHQRDATRAPVVTTEKFALQAVGSAPPPELLSALEHNLREGEGAFRWIETDKHPTPTWLRRLRQLQLPVAWFLLAQFPVWLLLAYWRAATYLAMLSRRARIGLVAAVGAAMVVRWVLAPLRLVVLYTGYQLTSHELTLQPLPRYGAAVAAFHHVLLRAFGPDHLTTLRAHSLIGVLMVPLVAAVVQAYTRRPKAALAAAFLWALVPAFVAHDNSEANTVPLLLWLVAGLLLWLDALDGDHPISLVGAAALLGLAAVGRPEFPVLVPAAVVALAIGRGRAANVTWTQIVPLVLAAAVLAVPHLVHVGESAALMGARDSLPMGGSLLGKNPVGVIDPKLYPIGLVLFAVLAVVLPGARRHAFPLLVVAALGFALTSVDLDPANILRVQVPAALFYALAVALGIGSTLELLDRRLPGPTPRLLVAGGALALTAFTALRCLPAAFARSNEDEEETFIREAVRAMPAGDAQLVRLGYGDVGGSLTGSPVHLYFPDYLFAPPGSGRTARGIRDWLRDRTHPATYFYLGTRCYTPEHPFPENMRPDAIPLRDACREILDHNVAAPVVERTAPSHGDPLGTGFYGTAIGAPMRFGLYRLKSVVAAP